MPRWLPEMQRASGQLPRDAYELGGLWVDDRAAATVRLALGCACWPARAPLVPPGSRATRGGGPCSAGGARTRAPHVARQLRGRIPSAAPGWGGRGLRTERLASDSSSDSDSESSAEGRTHPWTHPRGPIRAFFPEPACGIGTKGPVPFSLSILGIGPHASTGRAVRVPSVLSAGNLKPTELKEHHRASQPHL